MCFLFYIPTGVHCDSSANLFESFVSFVRFIYLDMAYSPGSSCTGNVTLRVAAVGTLSWGLIGPWGPSLENIDAVL